MLLGGAAAWFIPDLLCHWQARRIVRKVMERVKHPDRFRPLPPREPECRVVVHLTESGVRCERPDGLTEQVAWADLQRVEILTTDEGPFLPDLFWLLHGTTGGCAVPQGATGDGELRRRLGRLPGFDNGAVITAMGSTDNARFLCWQRAA